MSTKVDSSTSTSLRGLRNSLQEHAPLAHVVGDHQQDAGKRADRNALRQRPAANTITSSVTVWTMPAIGVRPPFFTLVAVRAMRAGRGNAAEERATQVGDALRHQLHVRAVPAADHAVGNDGGEQRLDRAEHRDREAPEEAARATCAEIDSCGSAGQGSVGGHVPEAIADGLDRQAEERNGQRSSATIATSGPGMREPRCAASTAAGRPCPARSRWRSGSSSRRAPPYARSFSNVSAGTLSIAEPEEVAHLRQRDDQRDPAGEADRHRVGHELDRAAQPREAHGNQQRAGHQRRDRQAVVAVASAPRRRR